MIPMTIRQKISNHPTITDLEREVVVYRFSYSMDVSQIPISARVEHFKIIDGERVLLPEFTKELKDWIVDNSNKIKKRDKNNKIVLDENNNEILIDAYDRYQELLIPFLEPFIKQCIKNDDEDFSRFDK